MHYAVHGNTAAEVIMEWADHTKKHMGLTSWRNAPNGKIVQADVSVAKNCLSINEIQELNEIVTMYLDYATKQARCQVDCRHLQARPCCGKFYPTGGYSSAPGFGSLPLEAHQLHYWGEKPGTELPYCLQLQIG